MEDIELVELSGQRQGNSMCKATLMRLKQKEQKYLRPVKRHK
jgi:hypothetical protein